MTSGTAAVGSGRRSPYTIGGATVSYHRQAILNGRRPREVEGCTTKYDQSPANACPFRYTVSFRFVPAMSVHGRLLPVVERDARVRCRPTADAAATLKRVSARIARLYEQQREAPDGADSFAAGHGERTRGPVVRGRRRRGWAMLRRESVSWKPRFGL